MKGSQRKLYPEKKLISSLKKQTNKSYQIVLSSLFNDRGILLPVRQKTSPESPKLQPETPKLPLGQFGMSLGK